MSVSVTKAVNNYTWDSCTLTWDEAVKTWNDMGEINYSVNADELLAMGIALAYEDLTESYSEYDKAFNELVTSPEIVTFEFSKNVSEKLPFVDRLSFANSITRNETIKLADSFDRTILKELVIAEVFAISDALSNHFDKWSLEELKLKDNPRCSFLLNKTITEPLRIAELYWDYIQFNMRVMEEFRVQDNNGKRLNKDIKEKISFSDFLAKAFSLSVKETAIITDQISKSYLKQPSETLTLKDKKPTARITKNIRDELKIADWLSKTITVLHKETLAFVDDFKRYLIARRTFVENMKLADYVTKNISLTKNEDVRLVDFLEKNLDKPIYEAFSVVDKYADKFIANRLFKENFSINEHLEKQVTLTKQELLDFYDCLIRAADGVLSNIEVQENPLTLAEFKNLLDTAPGFSRFMEFKVGEYEYQEALVRLIISAGVKQSKPSASGVVMHVDIPDTDDKGVVEITDTTVATKVYFNKFYYNPPEVVVTLKGGSSANGVMIPNIVSTDGKDDAGRYFEVELWDENWSARRTGMISWAAKGY